MEEQFCPYCGNPLTRSVEPREGGYTETIWYCEVCD